MHLQLSVGRWFQENGRSEDTPTFQNKCGTLNEMHGTIWNLTFLLIYYVHVFFRQCRHVHLLRVIIWYSYQCFQKWAYKSSRSWFFTMVRGNLMDNFSWTFLFLSEVPVLHRDLKQPKKLLVLKVGDLVRSICLNYAQSKSALQHLQRLTIEPYHFKTWLYS